MHFWSLARSPESGKKTSFEKNNFLSSQFPSRSTSAHGAGGGGGVGRWGPPYEMFESFSRTSPYFTQISRKSCPAGWWGLVYVVGNASGDAFEVAFENAFEDAYAATLESFEQRAHDYFRQMGCGCTKVQKNFCHVHGV